jgi:peptidoglycan hydrolase CwlO-like protein
MKKSDKINNRYLQTEMQEVGMTKSVKIFLVVMISVVILGGFGYTSGTENQPMDEAKEKLEAISETEKETVEALFILSSEIELLNTEMAKLQLDIEQLNLDSLHKSEMIEIENENFKNIQKSLIKILKHQQRSGVGSYLQMILGSENISDFLNRLNLIRDLSKNTVRLMEEIDVSKNILEREKMELEVLISEMENAQKTLEETLSSKQKAADALEAYLDSLEADKAYYQEYLTSIEDVWKSLKPMFSETVKAFNTIIEKGDLPEDTIEVRLSLLSAIGTIHQDKFNTILSSRQDLPELKFIFKENRVDLEFPSYKLELKGQFVLIDPQTVEFLVLSGSFYSLPLSESAIKDLFSEGDLSFRLQSILGKNTIRSITMKDKTLELSITIKLF